MLKKPDRKSIAAQKKLLAELRQWNTVVQNFRYVYDQDDKRVLALLVGRADEGKYYSVALESDAAASRDSGSKRAAERIFGDHAHDVVGLSFKTELLALTAANRYAEKWLKRRARAAKCACGPIEAPHAPTA